MTLSEMISQLKPCHSVFEYLGINGNGEQMCLSCAKLCAPAGRHLNTPDCQCMCRKFTQDMFLSGSQEVSGELSTTSSSPNVSQVSGIEKFHCINNCHICQTALVIVIVLFVVCTLIFCLWRRYYKRKNNDEPENITIDVWNRQNPRNEQELPLNPPRVLNDGTETLESVSVQDEDHQSTPTSTSSRHSFSTGTDASTLAVTPNEEINLISNMDEGQEDTLDCNSNYESNEESREFTTLSINDHFPSQTKLRSGRKKTQKKPMEHADTSIDKRTMSHSDIYMEEPSDQSLKADPWRMAHPDCPFCQCPEPLCAMQHNHDAIQRGVQPESAETSKCPDITYGSTTQTLHLLERRETSDENRTEPKTFD